MVSKDLFLFRSIEKCLQYERYDFSIAQTAPPLKPLGSYHNVF